MRWEIAVLLVASCCLQGFAQQQANYMQFECNAIGMLPGNVIYLYGPNGSLQLAAGESLRLAFPLFELKKTGNIGLAKLCNGSNSCKLAQASISFTKFKATKRAVGHVTADLPDGRKLDGRFDVRFRKWPEKGYCE